jgi:hypothetical protein
MNGGAGEAVQCPRSQNRRAVRDAVEAPGCSLDVCELDHRHGVVCAGSRPKPQSLPSTM